MAIKKVLFLLAISSLLMGCSTQKEPTNNTKEEDRIMHNESIYKDGVNYPTSLWEKPEYYFDESQDIDSIKGLYIRSDYNNEESYAFAYLGYPNVENKHDLPAILLLHGGGGTAYYEWVKRWNEKGFIALAIDLEGHVPLKSGNLTSYPNELYTKSKYDAPNNVNLNDGNKEVEQTWLYYATKTAIIGNSFLHSLEEVNSQKIGLCGISWGGYISSIISGYDDRFDFVIPIYCLLGMEESGTPIGSYVTQNPKFRVFDDITPITLVDTPIHFVISSKDQHENIFNASEICGLTKNGTLSIIQNFPHSHFDAVNQIDPYEFALREINNETNIKVEISNNKVNIIGDINKVTSIELFEADEENISANTTYYSTSLDVAKENELILDDNTTYYYVSIHDAKNVVISSKVFKK